MGDDNDNDDGDDDVGGNDDDGGGDDDIQILEKMFQYSSFSKANPATSHTMRRNADQRKKS